MKTHSDYQERLAWLLYCGGASESDIKEAVGDIARHEAKGDDLIREFGTPEEYAATFPAGEKRKARSTWPVLGGVLSLLWIVGALAAATYLGESLPVRVNSFVLWPALAIVVISLLTGFLVARMKFRYLMNRD